MLKMIINRTEIAAVDNMGKLCLAEVLRLHHIFTSVALRLC